MIANTLKALIFLNFILFSSSFGSEAEEFRILKNPINVDAVSSERLDSGATEFKVNLSIAENHFLYVQDLEIISELEGLNNANFKVNASPIMEFSDKFSNGEVKQGLKDEGVLKFKVPLGFNYNSTFKLYYRACTDEFCYLPKEASFDHNYKADEPGNTSGFTYLSEKIDFDSSSWLLIFLFVFVAGILTSFTPCIFPLIPITLALIQNNVSLGRFKSFQKTLIFVLGIAFTYSLLGILASYTGTLFGSALASPYVLIGVSLIYFVMAFSLFGFFDIQILGQLQNRFSKISTQSNFGVFIFGMITGIFASPCVGPVLIAILTYAAQSDNLIFSFLLLFIYALGLGQIFLALSLFSGLIAKLPKSGPWLMSVKYVLAIMLLLAGAFFAWPAVKSLTQSQPVDYNLRIEESLKSGQITIVDFRADWCAACKELELFTFKDPEVKLFIDKNNFIKVDLTVLSPETNQLIQEYEVKGLPHVIFFNEKGIMLSEMTISRYIKAKEFLAKIEALNSLELPKDSK